MKEELIINIPSQEVKHGKEVKVDYFTCTFEFQSVCSNKELEVVDEHVNVIQEILNFPKERIIEREFNKGNYRYFYDFGDSISLKLCGPMNKLLDILNGLRKNDVRSYTPLSFGKIALIDSSNNKIYAYTKLSSVRLIDYRKYILWHVCSTYSLEEAIEYYNMTFNKQFGNYYEYTFNDLEVIDSPIKIHNVSYKEYRNSAENQLKTIKVYFWKNNENKTVASCTVRLEEDKASVGRVYTFPNYRRKHYAENLVFEVSKEATDRGYTPILYTDADYAASNKCYQKIGFEIQGSVCSVGFENKE